MPIVTNAEVIEVKEISEDTRLYMLSTERSIYYEPGQFLQLALELTTASSPWPNSRPFSIANMYSDNGTIKLIIKKVGYFTEKIFNELDKGSVCSIKYAFGDFLLPFNDSKSKIICIAAGTGITPFLSFIEYLSSINQIERLVLHFSVKKSEDLKEYISFLDFIPTENIHIYITAETYSQAINRRIRIDDVISLETIADDNYYISGSASFIEFFRRELQSRDCKKIYYDDWI